MKLHLDNNIAEGTPEELVEYLRLVGAEAETASTDIKVGDRVKVLESESGAVGEATVTKVLENGNVELAGKSRSGKYLTYWANHVSNLEKIEAESTENDEEKSDEVDNSVYDKGAFYKVTDEAEDSALPVGAILQHQHGRMFRDSQGNLCIISNSSYVDRGSTYKLDEAVNQHRFELAKQLGIQLKTTTDFAVEARGKYFKVTKENSSLDVGDLVTISEDDKDDQPLCKDKYGNLSYAYLHDIELLEDAPMGYTFWYIDGVLLNHLNVLKTTIDGYFEDSKGRRYTCQDVSGLIKPLNREDVREKFEKARHNGKLLKYYPAVDVLVGE